VVNLGRGYRAAKHLLLGVHLLLLLLLLLLLQLRPGQGS